MRIRNASAGDLLPSYRENGGAKRQLLEPGDCVLAADLGVNDAYADLVVITAVDLAERRMTDVNCVSTNVNGVYVSHDSLYVGGENGVSIPEATVHRAAQVRAGRRRHQLSRERRRSRPIGWQNASYFMDEHEAICASSRRSSGLERRFVHRLHVLREAPNHALT